MIVMSLRDVATAVAGEPSTDADLSTVVSGRCEIDSRRVQPGDLFIAIKGDNHDGHDHVDAALAAGAVAAVVTADGPGPRILVPDTVAALAALARAILEIRSDVTVIALTGSSGKTSTKDIIGQLLATSAPTVWPEGSFNNELGLPLTVLRIDEETRYLVLEMGLSRSWSHSGVVHDR